MIRVENVSKLYRIYDNPSGRLKEILLRGRRKYHRDFWALHEVSLEVNQGETVGIFERNGAGKSMLNRAVNNSSGTIMAIDKTGKWWVGSDADDLAEYLAAFTGDGYLATEFRVAKCDCGSKEFKLAIDADEGTATRTCAECGQTHFICDSEEYWEDASPKKWKCFGNCKSKVANVCVGFALRDDRKDIHWIYVGTRCSVCGVLGCYGDWKVDYSPSLQLMECV